MMSPFTQPNAIYESG